jgi:hypothetical protein
MKSKRLIYIVISISLIFFLGCNKSFKKYKIKDVTKAKVILLKKESFQKHIHSVYIKIDGHIKGSASVVFKHNNKLLSKKVISGSVNFNSSGEWYSDSITIKYIPSLVKSGNLVIRYRFEDI